MEVAEAPDVAASAQAASLAAPHGMGSPVGGASALGALGRTLGALGRTRRMTAATGQVRDLGNGTYQGDFRVDRQVP